MSAFFTKHNITLSAGLTTINNRQIKRDIPPISADSPIIPLLPVHLLSEYQNHQLDHPLEYADRFLRDER
jgi:hypothetical protein